MFITDGPNGIGMIDHPMASKAQLPKYFAAWPGAWHRRQICRRFGRRRFAVALPGAGEALRFSGRLSA